MRIIKLVPFFILLIVAITFISVFEFSVIQNTSNSASSSLRFDEAHNVSYVSRRLLYDYYYNTAPARETNHMATIGPIIAAVVVFGIVIFVIFWCCRKIQEEEVTKVPVVGVNKYVKEENVPVVPVETIATASTQDFNSVEATASTQDFNSVEAKDQMYTYTQLVAITDNFRKVLGEGGFGIVYHGLIGKTEVAVKLLSRSSQQGSKEFLAEVNLLATIQHKNLTTLLGYLHEGLNMGIIYEYMANGTLENYLFRIGQVISWERRLQIAIDAAQGLEYLHHQCNPPIVHRDIKTTNILLDNKLQAKLSDFGLSRAFPAGGATHVATAVAGTFGYLDPEFYTTTGKITQKSDIYSFGVVLLELITGRPALPKIDSDQQPLVFWVSSQLETGAIANVVDTRLQVGDFSVNSGWKYLELAMACVAHNSNRRPPMNYVTMELQGCLQMHKYLANYENANSINSIGVPLTNNTGVPMSATSITSLSQLGTQLWPPRAR